MMRLALVALLCGCGASSSDAYRASVASVTEPAALLRADLRRDCAGALAVTPAPEVGALCLAVGEAFDALWAAETAALDLADAHDAGDLAGGAQAVETAVDAVRAAGERAWAVARRLREALQ
jgi:hypothetical protein